MEDILRHYLSWPGLEFCVMKMTHYGNTHEHSHDFCELVFVSSGEAFHSIGGNRYKIQTGDLFLIPPGVTHNYQESAIQIYNILFSEDFLKNLPSDLSAFANYQLLFHASPEIPLPQRILSLASAHFSEMTRLLNDIIDEEQNRTPGSMCSAFCGSLRLLLLICRHARFAENAEKPYVSHRISSLMAELETRYAEKWDLKKMAEYSGMSLSGFRQHFKTISGKSPVDYLIALRVRKASELLALKGKSIAEIASECGFRDSNYFSRIFRKISGMNPRACREHRKDFS